MPFNQSILPGQIPEAFREVFEALDYEVTWAHAKWRTFRQLFGASETIEVLNRAAPACARVMQDALMHEILLSLSRLTDAPTTGRANRDNLVLRRLLPLAESSGQEQLVLEIKCAMNSVDNACRVLREHRNKRIAHLDLPTALQTATLPPYSLDTIEAAFIHVGEVLNILNSHFRGGPTIYREVGMQGDGRSLIACLHDGLRLRRIRRDQRKMSEHELRIALASRNPQDGFASNYDTTDSQGGT